MIKVSDISPPCIILGIETQIGLHIIREIGQAGIPTIGITHDQKAIGLRSRWLNEYYIIKKPRSTDLLQLLRSLGEKHRNCPLIAISETNLLWLTKQSPKNIGSIRPILPSLSALQTVLDKTKTLELATQVGIQIPHTWQPISTEDINSHVNEFPVPAILKWKDPNLVGSKLYNEKLPLLKSEYIATTADLRNALQRYSILKQWPMVQEYCPGHGLGQFFFIRNGHAIRRFQHVRQAEWPPEGGFSSVCTGLSLNQHIDLQERSIKLLNLVGWEGVAMVEYRYDPQTKRAWLMEINGRFWGSFPLASQSGAKFALLAYLSATKREIPKLPPPRTNLRARMISTELKRLWRICFRSEFITNPTFQRRPFIETFYFISRFFSLNTRYYVWSWNDPLPFIQDVINMIWKRSA